MADLLEAIDDAAVLVDRTGRIERVNAAWQAFAAANDGAAPTVAGVGLDYLEVCRAAGADGAEVLTALTALLAGATPRFEHEYPCHSPDRARWFRVVATARPGAVGAVLVHRDVTSRWLGERRQRIWRAVLGSTTTDGEALEDQLLRHIGEALELDAAIHWRDTGGGDRRCLRTWQRSPQPPGDERSIDVGTLTHGLRLAFRVPIATEHKTLAVLEFFAAAAWPQDPALVETLAEVGGYVAQHASRRASERRLAQTQLLESLGELAAGVAHEINTPMQYVGDNLRFLTEAVAALHAIAADHLELLAAASHGAVGPELLAVQREHLVETDLEFVLAQSPHAVASCRDGVDRVVAIVTAMKRLSHGGAGAMAAVDLNAALEASLLVTHHQWKFVAEVITDLEPGLPHVIGQAGHLNQVFLNLIGNAAYAVGEVAAARPGGKGTITVASRQIGDHVEVRIADDGPGIAPALQARVFEPFFTTKAVGQGTGQGLAIAHAVVVAEHHGQLELDSAPGRGATFVVRLPIAGVAPAGAAPPD